MKVIVNHFTNFKWQNGTVTKVICPKCSFKDTRRLSDGRRKCKKCRSVFTPKIAGFRLSFYRINRLIECFCLGVPAFRLKYVMPLTRQTVNKFFRFLRQLIYDELIKEAIKLDGPNEMDETMFGGKRAGGRGWGATGKNIVFGVYKRNGRVIAFPISDRSRQTDYCRFDL